MGNDLVGRVPEVEADDHEGMDFLQKAELEKPAGQFRILVSPPLEIFIESVDRQNIFSEETHITRLNAFERFIPECREKRHAQDMMNIRDPEGKGYTQK